MEWGADAGNALPSLACRVEVVASIGDLADLGIHLDFSRSERLAVIRFQWEVAIKERREPALDVFSGPIHKLH